MVIRVYFKDGRHIDISAGALEKRTDCVVLYAKNVQQDTMLAHFQTDSIIGTVNVAAIKESSDHIQKPEPIDFSKPCWPENLPGATGVDELIND